MARIGAASAVTTGGTPGAPLPSSRKTHRGHRGGQRAHGHGSNKAREEPKSGPAADLPAPDGGGGGGNRKANEGSGPMREAKGLAQELKAMLKRNKDPWDRDIEYQRQRLRRQYLTIIFGRDLATVPSAAAPGAGVSPTATSPSSGHGKHRHHTYGNHHRDDRAMATDALSMLWLETSHSLIHLYRQRVSQFDKSTAEGAKNRHSRARADPGGRPVGTGAHKKLAQNFQSFLLAEDQFWRELVARLVRTFGVSEAEPALRALGLAAGTGAGFEAIQADGLEATVTPVAAVAAAETLTRRAMKHSQSLALVHKALICSGDLARYRELYSEDHNKRNGAEDRPSRRRGGRRGGVPGNTQSASAQETSSRTWARPSECYHQARLLLPDNGNPSNQLAVVASYLGDPLSSAYHYFRALCVRDPFPTARQNLELTFGKALGKWVAEGKGQGGQDPQTRHASTWEGRDDDGSRSSGGAGEEGETQGDDEQANGQALADRFKVEFVALHAMLFTHSRFEDEPELNAAVCNSLSQAVRLRVLPSELIVKIVVTAVAALWNARMNRTDSSNGRHAKPAASAPADGPSAIMTEALTATHALELFSALLDVAADELDGVESTSAGDLAQNITAVFRRILPALRIISKWTMGHIDYIQRLEDRLVSLREHSVEELRPARQRFWNSYAATINALGVGFPGGLLPGLDGGLWLEEDLDMLGFSPLRRGMKEGAENRLDRGSAPAARMADKAVHPNEEQLMRIADLQGDASLIAHSQGSPIAVEGGRIVTLREASAEDEEGPTGLSEAEPEAPARQHPSDAFSRGYPTGGLPSAPAPDLASPPQQRLGPLPDSQRSSDLHSHYDSSRPAAALPDSEYYYDSRPVSGNYGEEEELYAPTEDDPVDLAMRVVSAQQMAGDDLDDEDEVLYPIAPRQSLCRHPSVSHSAMTGAPSSPPHATPAHHRSGSQSYGVQPPRSAAPTSTADLLAILQGGRPSLPSPLPNAGLNGVGVGPSIWSATPAEGSPSALGGVSLPSRTLPAASSSTAAAASRSRVDRLAPQVETNDWPKPSTPLGPHPTLAGHAQGNHRSEFSQPPSGPIDHPSQSFAAFPAAIAPASEAGPLWQPQAPSSRKPFPQLHSHSESIRLAAHQQHSLPSATAAVHSGLPPPFVPQQQYRHSTTATYRPYGYG